VPDRAARSGTGLSEIEVEITPEMISAGLEAYYAADSRFCDAEYVVSSILRAGLAALNNTYSNTANP
jgi:hypothetical protein